MTNGSKHGWGTQKKFCKKSNGPPSIEDVLKNLMVHSYLFIIVS